jgi:hypothetical protein
MRAIIKYRKKGENMNKNIELTSLINDSILDSIFKEKEESLYHQNKYDKEKIKEIYLENPISYENLLIAIKNLPPHFNNTRENIIEKLEQYLERENSLSAYDNERFYKKGFCDGVKMMLEVLKEN